MFETTIENGYIDIEVEIEYDYQPYEAMTQFYPGCSESVDICSIIMIETGAEIFIIDEKFESDLKEQILDHLHEESMYNKYGYLLDERI